MRIVALCAALSLLTLGGCGSSLTTDVNTFCAATQLAEQADPALVTHNPKIVADGNTACAVASTTLSLIAPVVTLTKSATTVTATVTAPAPATVPAAN